LINFKREVFYQFICIHCKEDWRITNPDEEKEEWWCPHCGKSQNVPSLEKTPLIKSDNHIKYEDNLTESNCPNGGWWNPIKKECMGTGNGFIPRNT
jgi:DNA-directed RNA polymerase subunit RPC12/RpoP